MIEYFDVVIVKGGSDFASKSSCSTVNKFIESNFGELKNEKGEIIEKLTRTMYGKYKFYWNGNELK